MVPGAPQAILAKRQVSANTRPERLRTGPDQRAIATLLAVGLALPLFVYSLLLIERKWSVLLNAQPFLQTRILNFWEKAAFVGLVFATTLWLVVIAVYALRLVTERLFPRNSWGTKAVLASVGVVYFSAVTSQFQAFQYFQDTLNLAMMQRMGGGDFRIGLAYITNELAGMMPLVLLWLSAMVIAGYLSRRYGLRRAVLSLASSRPVRYLASGRGLLTASLAIMTLPILLALISPALSGALNFNLAYQICALPATYLTDIDGDGYGLLGSIRDFAPLDRSRHPYALEIVGNGVDETGIAGDLPRIMWEKSLAPPWTADALERKNVLLIVMDSARRDLLDADVKTGPVMPVLRGLSGTPVNLVSHAGFTVPSIVSLFNGTITDEEQGVSLIDRFNRLGYRTGVFSGQHEGFGGIASRAGLTRATVFVDATAFPPEKRMYESTTPAALAVPAPAVNAKFAEWLVERDDTSPFFAYINWQEMHFPYHYRGAPTPLIAEPVRREKITISNREQVWQTYMNAARSLDTALAQVVDVLKQAGKWENTLLLVLSDHGEELFEHGYLGHGVNLSYEQYAPVCKIMNSTAAAPIGPVGMNEVSNLIYNSLLRVGRSPVPMRGEVLCHTGGIDAPGEIGLMSTSGLIKYNFARRSWLQQVHHGASFRPAVPVNRIIQLWESYRLAYTASAGRGN